MKHIGELTEQEATLLRMAQAELREVALITAIKSSSFDDINRLYQAARHFDAICRKVGLDQYWLSRETIFVTAKTET